MARKKKKTKKQGIQEARDKIALRALQNMPGTDVSLRDNPDSVKMSDILEDFSDPLREESMPPAVYRILLTIAAAGWNIALFPKEQRHDQTKKFLARLPEEHRSTAVELFQYFIHRKDMYYKKINRFIVDYELVLLDDNSHYLTVASVPFNLPKNKMRVTGKDAGNPGS